MGPKRAAPKPRGGTRQRMARAREQPELQVKQSSLALYLVYMWSWGFLSPQLVQMIAQRAKDDRDELARITRARAPEGVVLSIPEFGDLNALAALGSDGRFPNNCNRDLMATLPRNVISVPTPCTLPLKFANTIGYRLVRQTIMWPHEMFATLYWK